MSVKKKAAVKELATREWVDQQITATVSGMEIVIKDRITKSTLTTEEVKQQIDGALKDYPLTRLNPALWAVVILTALCYLLLCYRVTREIPLERKNTATISFPATAGTMHADGIGVALINPVPFYSPPGGISQPVLDGTVKSNTHATITTWAWKRVESGLFLEPSVDCWIGVYASEELDGASTNLGEGFWKANARFTPIGYDPLRTKAFTVRSGCPGKMRYWLNGDEIHPTNVSKAPDKSEVVLIDTQPLVIK